MPSTRAHASNAPARRRWGVILNLLLVVAVLLSVAVTASAQEVAPEAPTLTQARPLADRGARPTLVAPGTDGRTGYIVSLEGEPLATYRGGVQGLAATSPATRGERKLNLAVDAAVAYRTYLAERREAVIAEAERALGRQLEIEYEYDVVLNGFATRLSTNEAPTVAALRGVVRVNQVQWRYPETDVSPAFIGATTVWDGTGTGMPGTKGAGVKVGILDTGIWPEHSSFADDGSYPAPVGWNGTCQPPADASQGYTCNNKLIGVQFFLTDYISSNGGTYDGKFNSGRDDNGHGTHTASTTGGNENVPVTLLGVSRQPVSGIAPRAHVASYKVLGPGGGTTADIVAGINKAVADGVDVINGSLGGTPIASPWVDDDSVALLNARDAGVFAAFSAGNNGPGADTIGSPGNAPWVTTSGASTSDRHFISDLAVTGPGAPPAGLWGASVTAGVTSFWLVDATGIPDNKGDASGLCSNPYNPGTFQATDVVLCKRGGVARVARGDNVQAGGGGGVILYNQAANMGLDTDNYVIPAVHVVYETGLALKNYVAAHPNQVYVSFTQGEEVMATDPRVVSDMMADFSSRGPARFVPDVIKPSVTAPGVQIMAGNSPDNMEPGQQGEYFMVIPGTSMSSPHTAGAGALLTALHPTWTPSEIESALMTTGNLNHVKEDAATPAGPFDLGGGRIDLTKAGRAGLVLNETKANYQAANPSTGGNPAALNLASVAEDNCYKTCSWTRTVRNPTTQGMNWSGTFTGQNGLQGTLTNASFALAGNATHQWGLNVDVTNLQAGRWYFGTVTFVEAGGKAPDAHFPVAVKVAGSTDGAMIEKTASPTGAGANAQITYSVVVKNTVKSSRSFSVSDLIPAGTTYVANSATGGWTYNSGTNTVSGNVSLGPAAFVWREKNLSGYQSMAAEGIPPADLTDVDPDTGCFSLGEMNFYYLDQQYTDVLISRNGVMRAGVPSGARVPCPSNTPQDIPSPDSNRYKSNDNLLAPFWADLDLTGGNMYLVATLYDGKLATVIEWKNALVKQTNQRVSFQLWIEDGTDNIWFAYPSGFNLAVGSASPTATIGAENSDGTEAAKYYYYSGSSTKTGNVPDGTKDVWVGLEPATATLGFKVNAGAAVPATIVNEASTTVSTTTNKAWAATRICGAASAAQPKISLQGKQYTLNSWQADGWNSFELYRSTSPYVAAGAGGNTLMYAGKNSSFVDQPAPVVGDPAVNHFYVLRTLNCAGTSIADSGWVAEFDFGLVKGQ